MNTKFNPRDHLIQVQGKDYLPVAYRLVWFREEHADWGIKTELVKLFESGAIFKAQILDEKGSVVAEAHKMETKAGFGDYLEKAETGSIGRALAMCGFGTQFSPDLDEGQRLADSPLERKNATEVNLEASETKLRGDITMPQLGKIKAMYAEKKLEPEAMKLVLKDKFGIGSARELSKQQASEYITYLMDISQPIEDDILSTLNGEL